MLTCVPGHMGDLTVKHVVRHLPVVIRDVLREAFRKQSDRNFAPQFISDLLSQSITSFDNAIAQDVLDLFPGGLQNISAYSDAELRRVINDQHTGGENYYKVRLCVYGTTALVALVDPERENLWVANLGDCQAGASASPPPCRPHWSDPCFQFWCPLRGHRTGTSKC
jgi:pyruvate dehydrogenase phosphatase